MNLSYSYYFSLQNCFIVSLQSKVDNLGMYHALAKKIQNYNGGTYIKNDLVTYIEMHKNKYKVISIVFLCWLNFVREIFSNIVWNIH